MADRKPVWQTKEWREAKKRLLKDRCQQCGSGENLALVHLWKPPRYASVAAKVERDLLRVMVDAGDLEPFDDSVFLEERDSCPSCGSVNIRKRKTKLPPYRCGRCANEFADPEQLTVRDDAAYSKAFRSWKEKHLKGREEEVQSEIREILREYNRRYRSGEGTTTFCRKCAFLYTQKHKILCGDCGESYHLKRYDRCYTCNQRDRLVTCNRCGEVRIEPQPGGINICQGCQESMWDEMTN